MTSSLIQCVDYRSPKSNMVSKSHLSSFFSCSLIHATASGASQTTLSRKTLLFAKLTAPTCKPVNSMPRGICISADSRFSSPCTSPLSKCNAGLTSRVLARTYSTIEELLASEEQITKLKASSNSGIKSGAKSEAEIERLTMELEKKDRDLQAMKRQAEGTNKAYDDLADQHSKVTAKSGDNKKSL
jgi:hypothetical protein